VRYRDFFTRLMLEQLRLLFGYGFRQFTGEGGAKTLAVSVSSWSGRVRRVAR
jgi:hypothetical protein